MKSKILSISIGILTSVCIIEISLRIIGYLYVSSEKQANFESTQKETGQYTICCFGDSYTIGIDDLPGYGGYPKRLEKMLNKSSLKRRFKVINCAGSAFNSSLTLLAVKNYLEKYNPELIIVFIGANDHWNYTRIDPKIIQGYKNFLGSKYWIIKAEIFLSKFKIFKLLKICLINLKSFFDKRHIQKDEDKATFITRQFINLRCELIQLYESLAKGKLQKEDFEKIKNMPGIIQSQAITKFNLLQIVNLAKSKGVKVVLQNYPDHYANVVLQKVIDEVALGCRITLVDNTSVFRKLLLQERYEEYFVPNGHCNAKGYDVIAKNVFKTLINSKVLEY